MYSLNVITGVPNTPGAGKIDSFNDGYMPYFEEANFLLTGVSRDSNGNPLGNCVVKLFNTATDIKEQQTISDAAGNYSFVVDKTQRWYFVEYKAGFPDVSGTSVNTLFGQIPGSNVSVFTTQIPVASALDDTQPITVGMRFRSSVAGNVVGVRYYKKAGMGNTHTGLLYSNAGTQLASAPYSNESATGWQSVLFSSPVAILANTTYMTATFMANNFYIGDNGYFVTSLTTNVLTALADGTDGNQCVYTEAGVPTFPASFNGNQPNYWVDVIFQAT